MMILSEQRRVQTQAIISSLRWIALMIVLGVLGVSISACQPSHTPEQQLLSNTANQAILPFHQQLATSAKQLSNLSKQFCQQLETNQWQLLRNNWLKTMIDWQAVKLIQFGPVNQDNQHWKIQFWPDKHNLVRKKINELLNSTDELTIERVRSASVVVQGLSAMEYLLFDDEGGQLALYKEGSSSRQCNLLVAIAAHTQEVTERLNYAWQPNGGNYLVKFTQPNESNIDLQSNEMSIAALVDTLVASLETIKRDQLAAPLGYRQKEGYLVKLKARPYLSQAWRSRSSLQLLQANLNSAQTLYNSGISDYLQNQKSSQLQELGKTINKQFDIINNQLEEIELPLFEAANNDNSSQRLESIYKQVTQLVKLHKNNLPAAMGVTLGFNDNDGD